MKCIAGIFATFFVLAISSAVYADNDDSSSSKKGSFFLNANGGIGTSVFGDSYSLRGGPDQKWRPSYDLGVKAGYCITELFTPFLGIQRSSRPIRVYDNDDNSTVTIKNRSTDILLGLRVQKGILFAGGGAFYGIADKNPDVEYRGSSGSGSSSFRDMYSSGKIRNDFGMFFTGGVSIFVANRLSFDAGVQLQRGYLYSLKFDGNSLTFLTATVNAGFSMWL
jgi:hypothetical protein